MNLYKLFALAVLYGGVALGASWLEMSDGLAGHIGAYLLMFGSFAAILEVK